MTHLNINFDRHTTHFHLIGRSLSAMAQQWRQALMALVIVVVIVELGGIWHELHQVRNEQVRNALFSLPAARQQQMRGGRAEAVLRSTTHVDGEVSIDDAAQPIRVEIDQ